MNKQADLDKAAKKVSHDALSGRLEQSGQKFSPLSLPPSPAVQTAKAPCDAYLVPIGRPLEDDSHYERLKKAAETDPSDGPVVEGQQDESALKS